MSDNLFNGQNLLKYITETMERLERTRTEANDVTEGVVDRLLIRTELLLNLLQEYRGEPSEHQLLEVVTVASEIENLVPELRQNLVHLLDADGRCRTMPAVRDELLRLQEGESNRGD
jgi:hypothetical protein